MLKMTVKGLDKFLVTNLLDVLCWRYTISRHQFNIEYYQVYTVSLSYIFNYIYLWYIIQYSYCWIIKNIYMITRNCISTTAILFSRFIGLTCLLIILFKLLKDYLYIAPFYYYIQYITKTGRLFQSVFF